MKLTIHQKKWKKLVHRTCDAAADVREAARAAAQAAGRRAENAAARARLERAIRDVQEEVELQLGEIGRLMYATHRGEPAASDSIQQILEYLDSLYEELDGYQSQLKQMRGVLLCEACGAENAENNVYCHNCGRALERA